MFVGLDIGTAAVKALIVDPSGRVLSRASRQVGMRHSPDGGVEQDFEEIWQACLAALRDLGEASLLPSVEAVGVSSQGGALLLRDAARRPLGPVVSWLDGRGRPYDRRFTESLGPDWFARRIGHGSSGLAIGHLARLREEQPDLLASAGRVGFVGDAAVERLCGRAAHDATSLSIALLYNPWRGEADPDVLALVGLERDRLPDLLPVLTPAGPLNKEMAAATGLPAGIPVGPAVHDQYAAALAAGATRPGEVMLGLGTAWVLLAVSAELRPPAVPAAFVCTHPVEGLSGQMLSMVNGGSAAQWALRLTGTDTSDLEGLAGSVPPGSAGLRFWPLLAPGGGAGLPRGTAGRLLGLRLHHGPAHLLRAVLEGLALELARHLRLLQEAGIAAERLRGGGGGASGHLTPQIIADATGKPLFCSAERDLSAFGAAVLARALVEPARPLADLADSMRPPQRPFEPGPDAATYAGMLEEYLDALATEAR